MSFDLRTHLIRYNAEYDQSLAVYRRYYESMNPNHQRKFKSFLSLLCTEKPVQALSIELSIDFEGSSASIHPEVLVRAIRKWDRGGSYTRLIIPVS